MLTRRGLITGLISLAAAPAIVRYSSLMPVKVVKAIEPELIGKELVDYFIISNPIIGGNFIHRFYIENDELKREIISDFEFYKGPQW